MDNTDTRPIQLQTHPNVDRDLWRSCGQIGMKMSNKPFPPNTDVGVLKWRFQTTDESQVPLSSKFSFSVALFSSCSSALINIKILIFEQIICFRIGGFVHIQAGISGNAQLLVAVLSFCHVSKSNTKFHHPQLTAGPRRTVQEDVTSTSSTP